MKIKPYEIKAVLFFIVSSLYFCACEPPAPEFTILPLPQKLPVYVTKWDSLEIKTIHLDIKEELYYKSNIIKKLNAEKSGIEDYLVFIFSNLGIQVVDIDSRPECTLIVHFKGTALPWSASNYPLYLGGQGNLKIKLTIDNRKPIGHNVKPSIPIPETSFIQNTKENFKRMNDPENYQFEVLWMDGLDEFLIETFGRPLTIYKEVYENLDGGGWGTSVEPWNPTETNFNSLLTLLNYDNRYAPVWAIGNLERSFPDRMNEEVIPYLPQIMLSSTNRYHVRTFVEVMSKYIDNQKYFVIPTLLELLANNDKYIREAAHDKLMKVSSRDFEYDTIKWNNWWHNNHSRIGTVN